VAHRSKTLPHSLPLTGLLFFVWGGLAIFNQLAIAAAQVRIRAKTKPGGLAGVGSRQNFVRIWTLT